MYSVLDNTSTTPEFLAFGAILFLARFVKKMTGPFGDSGGILLSSAKTVKPSMTGSIISRMMIE